VLPYSLVAYIKLKYIVSQKYVRIIFAITV